MNRFVEHIATRPPWAWGLGAAIVLASALAAGFAERSLQEREHLSLLQLDVQRHAIEAQSLTLNGKLMGAIALLGLIDPDIKHESRNSGGTPSPHVQAMLEDVARAHHVQGVFVIAADGIVTASWDNSGRPSTGLDVRFRPYFQAALHGRDNVYAAVSLSRADRALYFAAPVYPGQSRGGSALGAVVARTDMSQVDKLLDDTGHTALLLSPQGLVFASNRPEWLGALAGAVTPQRVSAIRALRQFGSLFENQAPRTLPFLPGTGLAELAGRRHAVASLPVDWHDPAGDWQLVLLEDLSSTIPPAPARYAALLAAVAALFVVLIVVHLLKSQYAQQLAARQLEDYARRQADSAERKMQLAQVALRLQQAQDARSLAQAFLSECHRLFGALQGVVYACDDDRLQLAASFSDGAAPASLALGEGLLGQCAIEREVRVVDTAGKHSPWTIHSGLGAARPAALLLAPVLLQGGLLGVVELALLKRPEPALVDQFRAAVELLAFNMEIKHER